MFENKAQDSRTTKSGFIPEAQGYMLYVFPGHVNAVEFLPQTYI